MARFVMSLQSQYNARIMNLEYGQKWNYLDAYVVGRGFELD